MSSGPTHRSNTFAILAAARAALPPLPPLGSAQPQAAPRNTAQQAAHAVSRTNPPRPRPRRLEPRQMTAARLLLAGYAVADVAAELGVHPYTISRWKRDPVFDAELRRQVDGATPRNTAQQNPTRAMPPARNEPNAARQKSG